MWSSINPEEVKKLLETKSIEEVARHFKMSKWVMYKYTSYYKIDVWACKRAGKKSIPIKPKRPPKKRQEKIYNSVVYGDLTPEKLTVLLKKYTPKQLCFVFHINYWALHKKAQRWKISMNVKPELNPKYIEAQRLKEEKSKMCECLKCHKQFLVSKLHNGYCHSCYDTINRVHDCEPAVTELGKKIQELLKENLSYCEIARQLGCSKSTVRYYSKQSVKDHDLARSRKFNSSWKGRLISNFYGFRHRKKGNGRQFCKDPNKKIRTIVSKFRHRKNLEFDERYIDKDSIKYYSYQDVLKYLGPEYKCYLTGTKINLETDDYALDHIMPVSRGGTNDITNLGLTLYKANQMKGDLTVPELLDMCEKILLNYGYTVTKNNE